MAYGAWYQSLMIQPPIVMGRRLKPFSMIQRLTLENFDSPFITHNRPITRADVTFAVMVCSRDWAGLQAKFFHDFMWIGIWWDAIRATFYNWQSEADRLTVYINAYSDTPDVDNSKKSTHKAPWQFHAVHIICKEYHFPEEKVWNMALNRVLCYVATASESWGNDVLRDGYDTRMSALALELEKAEADHDREAQIRIQAELAELREEHDAE